MRGIVLHHTGTGTGNGDGADIVRSMENTCRRLYGGRYKNFYHIMVGPTGRVFDGQPLGTTAPHCGIDTGDRYQHSSGITNQNSIAISAIGNFQHNNMPDAQKLSLANELRKAKAMYPRALVKLHRELVSTSCPGINYPYQEIYKLSEGKKMRDVTMTIHIQGDRKFNIEMSDGKIIPISKDQNVHPVIIGETAWLPVRIMQQAMRADATIQWDAIKKIITINWKE